ncbi:MAG: hypothetical protein H0U16_01445 [Actinobacteria bacterium]|nr:hypothetical protein [Actinomycetota bacterium]
MFFAIVAFAADGTCWPGHGRFVLPDRESKSSWFAALAGAAVVVALTAIPVIGGLLKTVVVPAWARCC